MTHLNTLSLRLSNERARLSQAKTDQEWCMRSVWVEQLEKEIEDERSFLGLNDSERFEGSDDDLLHELGL